MAFDKGFERGKADMLEISGVDLAKGYNDEANKYNEQNPGHTPMVDSFGDISGVGEAMKNYRVGKAIIEVYRDT